MLAKYEQRLAANRVYVRKSIFEFYSTAHNSCLRIRRFARDRRGTLVLLDLLLLYCSRPRLSSLLPPTDRKRVCAAPAPRTDTFNGYTSPLREMPEASPPDSDDDSQDVEEILLEPKEAPAIAGPWKGQFTKWSTDGVDEEDLPAAAQAFDGFVFVHRGKSYKAPDELSLWFDRKRGRMLYFEDHDSDDDELPVHHFDELGRPAPHPAIFVAGLGKDKQIAEASDWIYARKEPQKVQSGVVPSLLSPDRQRSACFLSLLAKSFD